MVKVSSLLGYPPNLLRNLRKKQLPKTTTVNSLIAHSLRGVKIGGKRKKGLFPNAPTFPTSPSMSTNDVTLPNIKSERTQSPISK